MCPSALMVIVVEKPHDGVFMSMIVILKTEGREKVSEEEGARPRARKEWIKSCPR